MSDIACSIMILTLIIVIEIIDRFPRNALCWPSLVDHVFLFCSGFSFFSILLFRHLEFHWLVLSITCQRMMSNSIADKKEKSS